MISCIKEETRWKPNGTREDEKNTVFTFTQCMYHTLNGCECTGRKKLFTIFNLYKLTRIFTVAILTFLSRLSLTFWLVLLFHVIFFFLPSLPCSVSSIFWLMYPLLILLLLLLSIVLSYWLCSNITFVEQIHKIIRWRKCERGKDPPTIPRKKFSK